MRNRAFCPNCDARVSRAQLTFTWRRDRKDEKRCRACGVRFRDIHHADLTWLVTGPALLALFGFVWWWMFAVALTIPVLVIAGVYWINPYVVDLQLVDAVAEQRSKPDAGADAPSRRARCPKCGFALYPWRVRFLSMREQRCKQCTDLLTARLDGVGLLVLCGVMLFVLAVYAGFGGASLKFVVLGGLVLTLVWPWLFVFTEGRESEEVKSAQTTVMGRGIKQAWYRWRKTWPAYQGGHGVGGFFMSMWRERLTRPGRYIVTGAVATGIAGSFPDKMIGSLAFSFFASMLLLALFISIVWRPRVRVVRRAPERAMAGTSVPITIRVTNELDEPVHDIGAYEFRLPPQISLDDEPQYVAVLEPRQTQAFEYNVIARRRGSYVLDGPTAVSTFPFGLTQSKAFHPDQHRLIVYPAFEPLVHLDIPVGWSYQPGGVALASHVGESMEFIGTREYQPGDRIRDLHPKSWARVGTPVVRQFEQEFHTRVALLVDTYAPYRVESMFADSVKLITPRHAKGVDQLFGTDVVFGPGGAHEVCLEANLSLAGAIADYLARKEYVVDLFAAGPQLYHFQAGRSLAYLDNILDILACLEVSHADPFDLVGAEFNQQLRQTSTLISLMMVWDDKREGFLQSIRESGVRVKAILVSDDASQREAAEATGVQTLSVSEVQQGVETL